MKRNPNGPNESEIQQAVITWWAFAHRGLGVKNENRLFAIANGGFRSARTGARLKKEGVRAGICDLILLVPRGDCHALCIEMKRPGGRLQENQFAFLKDVITDGYATAVAYSVDEARRVIETYLKLQPSK